MGDVFWDIALAELDLEDEDSSTVVSSSGSDDHHHHDRIPTHAKLHLQQQTTTTDVLENDGNNDSDNKRNTVSDRCYRMYTLPSLIKTNNKKHTNDDDDNEQASHLYSQQAEQVQQQPSLKLYLSSLPLYDGIWSPLGAQAWYGSALLTALLFQQPDEIDEQEELQQQPYLRNIDQDHHLNNNINNTNQRNSYNHRHRLWLHSLLSSSFSSVSSSRTNSSCCSNGNNNGQNDNTCQQVQIGIGDPSIRHHIRHPPLQCLELGSGAVGLAGFALAARLNQTQIITTSTNNSTSTTRTATNHATTQQQRQEQQQESSCNNNSFYNHPNDNNNINNHPCDNNNKTVSSSCCWSKTNRDHPFRHGHRTVILTDNDPLIVQQLQRNIDRNQSVFRSSSSMVETNHDNNKTTQTQCASSSLHDTTNDTPPSPDSWTDVQVRAQILDWKHPNPLAQLFRQHPAQSPNVSTEARTLGTQVMKDTRHDDNTMIATPQTT